MLWCMKTSVAAVAEDARRVEKGSLDGKKMMEIVNNSIPCKFQP